MPEFDGAVVTFFWYLWRLGGEVAMLLSQVLFSACSFCRRIVNVNELRVRLRQLRACDSTTLCQATI
jgi:hypothetical protein